ncbi:hypothetical protein C5167_012156 [Papaver somniferum]|uniref:Secreted protein n=1 Tax=Papaver somniferum TaxID=3469 RepID=A0A4Y7J0M3_PAPSO|nr:hypothetical protein C5167_012156 [Papaver somniferum]
MGKGFLRVLFAALMLVLVMMSAAPHTVNAGEPSWGNIPEDADGQWDENDG